MFIPVALSVSNHWPQAPSAAPAVASMRLSLPVLAGAKTICHVSEGCVSTMAFVELSFRFQTRIKESRALDAA